MKLMLSIASAALLLAAAAAAQTSTPSAKADPPKGRQCFYVRDINNYAADDADHLFLRVGVNHIYRLDMFSSCPELPWADRAIGVRSFGGSSWICDPLDVEIVVRDQGFHDRCQVRAITELTPDQVKALPKREQP
jgi:hypothetical protein